jgi:cytidine deaminase
VREHSYSPYSAFAVGAALLCEDGTIVTGCNVENASYGLTICAEQAAVTAAVAQGHRRFIAIAVAGPPQVVPPCGACRQVLAEFAPEITILYGTGEKQETASLAELLPVQFELP